MYRILLGDKLQWRDYLGLGDEDVWNILEPCWRQDPIARPTIENILDKLEAIYSL